jgi:hypothetical protein
VIGSLSRERFCSSLWAALLRGSVFGQLALRLLDELGANCDSVSVIYRVLGVRLEFSNKTRWQLCDVLLAEWQAISVCGLRDDALANGWVSALEHLPGLLF